MACCVAAAHLRWVMLSVLLVVTASIGYCYYWSDTSNNATLSKLMESTEFAEAAADLASSQHRFLDEEQQNENEYNDQDDEGEEEEGEDEEEDAEQDQPGEEQDEEDDATNNKYNVDDFYAFPEDPVLTLFPLGRRDVIGFLLTSMCVILAAAAGVGGGGMILPIYMLVLELPPSIASPLSAVTMLGGAVACTLLNLGRRHPLADRPLIDWDIILVMEPIILVGTIIGLIFQQILSDSVLVVILMVFLGAAAHRTLSKAETMYKAEEVYIEQRKAAAAAEPYQDVTIMESNSSAADPLRHFQLTEAEKNEIRILDPDYLSLRTDLTEEEKATSGYKILAVCCMFSVAIFLNTMLGGGGFPSPWGIRCGSMVFWLVHVILFEFLLAFAWAARTYLVNRHEIKELADYDFVHGDVKWDARNAILYPFIFFCAGLFAGMFGIGGGVVSVPLMLVMGVHPEVATATSSCMILFTTIASTTSYAVFGLIHWDYAAACGLIGFCVSLFGKIIMKRAKKDNVHGIKFKRDSFIAYAVGGVLLLSGLLLTINFVFVFEGYEENEHRGICLDSRL